MSHQAYGPRVGVPRILDLLAAHGIEGYFFVPGVTAERWSKAVEKILDAGHKVALHGHSHRVLPGTTPEQQRRDLELGLEALARLGVGPAIYGLPWDSRATSRWTSPSPSVRFRSVIARGRPPGTASVTAPGSPV